MTTDKQYLGDGVYAALGERQIVLTTEDGISATNTIYLDPDTLAALTAYGRKVFGGEEEKDADAGEDDALGEYLEHARVEMFPKLKNSAMSLTIVGNPDPKLCLELGAAILFDKPIIALVFDGRAVPANLARVATEIVQTSMGDPDASNKIQGAIGRVIANDARAKGPKQ